MNHTAEELLQVSASDVVLPGVAMSGWISQQSDWLRSWDKRWLVLLFCILLFYFKRSSAEWIYST